MKAKISFALMLVILLAAPLWAKGPNGSSNLSTLTVIEKENILYLFEEEKLAHDIYVAMYDLYGAYIFDNIIESEQRHMDAVKTLISRYGLDESVLNKDPGVFNNEIIQGLYDDLLADGNKGLTFALEVGVFIEETDMDDILKMKEQTGKADITRVFDNLLGGSQNHLEAFESQLPPAAE
jgi:hypothetical protein